MLIKLLITTFSLLWSPQVRIPGPGGAPGTVPIMPTLVASVCGPVTASSNGGSSSAIDTTGANFLVLTASAATGNALTISDLQGSGSNTYTSNHDTFSALYIAYVQNPSHLGPNHTFSVTGGSVYASFCVYAFSAMATSGVYESFSFSSSGHQPGTPPVIGSGHQLFVTTAYFNSTSTNTIDGSFSSPITRQFTSNNYGNSASYLIQTGNAPQNPAWTRTGDGTVQGIAVFQGQ